MLVMCKKCNQWSVGCVCQFFGKANFDIHEGVPPGDKSKAILEGYIKLAISASFWWL
jgi:hypothetical protein